MLRRRLGSLSNHDGEGKESVTLKMTSQSLKLLAIILTHLVCLMKPNYPGAEFVRTVLQFRKKNEKSTSCVHASHKTLSLVISCCICAQNSNEMYQHTCRVIVLQIRAFVL